jgi:hypothetical protein
VTFQKGLTYSLSHAAPTGVTIGVTAPDIWFPITNGSTVYMVPGWSNH